MLIYLFFSLNETVSSNVLIKSENEMYERVFQLLTVHKIEDAVSLLEEHGAFRLALMISQLGSDASTVYIMRTQFENWRSMECLETFPQEIVRLYQLMAGYFHEPIPILTNIGWKRALAMLFWYFSESENPAIGNFSSMVGLFGKINNDDDRLVDVPETAYAQDRDKIGAQVSYPAVKHSLYSLLRLLFHTEEDEETEPHDDEVLVFFHF